jgi:Amt family ammonium transporter
VGVLTVGAYTLAISVLAWAILKVTMGIRVSDEEEMEGLDMGEHGNLAYPDFRTASFGDTFEGVAKAASAIMPGPAHAVSRSPVGS